MGFEAADKIPLVPNKYKFKADAVKDFGLLWWGGGFTRMLPREEVYALHATKTELTLKESTKLAAAREVD